MTRPSGPHLVNVFLPFDKTAENNEGGRVMRASNGAHTRPRTDVIEKIRRNLTLESVGRVEAKLDRISPEPLPRPAVDTARA